MAALEALVKVYKQTPCCWSPVRLKVVNGMFLLSSLYADPNPDLRISKRAIKSRATLIGIKARNGAHTEARVLAGFTLAQQGFNGDPLVTRQKAM